MVSAGFGMGEFDIDTDRLDMGTGNTRITATGVQADIEYYHLSAMALSRGRITMPKIIYKNFEIDNPAFTDVVGNDSNTAGPSNDDNTTGTNALGKNTADVSIAALSASSKQTEVGINASMKVRSLNPFIESSYVSEDTTTAQYKTELTADDFVEKAASDPDSYTYAVLVVV